MFDATDHLLLPYSKTIRLIEKCDPVDTNFMKPLANQSKNLFSKVALSDNLYYLCIVSESKKHRTIIVYKNYFEEFFLKQKQKVKDKILWTFNLIEELPRVPEQYLKHIEGINGLYEIRIQQASDIFRILCFFDEGNLIALANAFHKKTQKTQRQEIEKAILIKEE